MLAIDNLEPAILGKTEWESPMGRLIIILSVDILIHQLCGFAPLIQMIQQLILKANPGPRVLKG
jgi:hypothetical protein